MKYAGEPLTAALNAMAGTDGLAATGAANAWAGTSGLALLAALNRKAGTSGLGLGAVLNRLAGAAGYGEQLAALLIPDESGMSYARLSLMCPTYAVMASRPYEEWV